MASQNTATASGGSGTSLLAVAFIVLKLCHVIDWSWWWVLAPIWIPLALVAAIIAVGLVVVAVKR